MNTYSISFTDEDGFIESINVEAACAEAAQESAIDFWEAAGIVHGAITIRVN